MRFRVLPYRQGSKSAKALAQELGGKVLKLQNSKFKPKPSDIVINWGNTQQQESTIGFWGGTLNNSAKIIQASNKLKFFKLLEEHHPEIIPKFWTNKNDIPDSAYPVVCRTILAGHSGAGIVIANDSSGVVDAGLYVQYVKKKDEYRVHIGRNSGSDGSKIIAVQRKAKKNGFENANWQVRNLANGFIYVRENVNPHPSVIAVAKKAFEATGLDFGAVDVIWNENQEKSYVLEINTAPGLEGQTIKDYAEFFRGVL
jgi:glutathione synthase/RimK-type ligase-like ATP-grasp enzyme